MSAPPAFCAGNGHSIAIRMSLRSPILVPTALSHGERARRAVEAGLARWLAGGPIAFSGVDVRAGSGSPSIVPVADLKDDALAAALDRIAAPRPALAGIPLDRPRVMGIVNATPDSFSDGGDHAETKSAIAHGEALIGDGADILDIGGESTRPGATPVTVSEEIDRVVPVIEGLKSAGVPISIDTRNAATMRAAITAGAAIVNDVSALAHDPKSAAACAKLGVPVVLMHMRGEPATMTEHAVYGDVASEVYGELADRLDDAVAAGVARERILVDPGFGFAKTSAQNLKLLRDLACLHALGAPILVGASRKSFLGAVTRGTKPKERIGASLAAALAAFARGVQVVRVHDVADTVQSLEVWRAIVEA